MIPRRGSLPGIQLILLIIAVFLSPVIPFAQENPCSFSGYLWGTGARTTFEVYADTEDLSMLFTWPEGTADFRVKVTGTDKKEVLIDRPLSEGDLFTLSGAGIYYFEIYSAWGGGCWKATIKKNQ
jgi:hypothetical protein